MHARFSAMKTGLIKIKSRVIWSLGKGCQVRWAARKRKYGVWWHWTWMSPSHTSFIKSLSHNSTGKDPRSLNKVVISHNCFMVLVIDLFWKHSKTPWPAEPSRLSSVTLWRPLSTSSRHPTQLRAVSGSAVPAIENLALFFPLWVYK